MPYTSEQLKNLPNLYEIFKNADALVEHREQLDALSEKDMHSLATKILMACPNSELKTLRLGINALYRPFQETCFYEVLSNAYTVKKSLLALQDTHNPRPHTVFLGDEFNPDLSNAFETLASSVISGNEDVIAEQLGLKTPDGNRSEVARNIRIVFPGTPLAEMVGAKFEALRTTRHNTFFASSQASQLKDNKPSSPSYTYFT